MKLFLKKALCLAISATFIFTMNAYAVDATPINDTSSQFNVTVETSQGQAVPDASVFIYSFADDRIVSSGITDVNGACNLRYLPDFDEEERDTIYHDFLIYVQKDGYVSSTWDLTKFYDYDDSNETDFIIQLSPDNQITTQTALSASNANVLRYVADLPEQPFYVIRGSELQQATTRGTNATAASTFWNEDVPLGHFHVNKGSTLTVGFTTSDKVSVESGVLNDLGSFSIKLWGNRRREFSTETTFPAFTTSLSTGRKRLYSTSGTFEHYYTVDGPSGRINEHYVLDSINGGTILGSITSCSDCNAPYEDVDTDYGTYIPVLEGGSVTITNTNMNGNKIDFGLSVPLDEMGLDFSLGVELETTSETDLTYVPKSGYNIALYDIDRSKEEWHITYELAN